MSCISQDEKEYQNLRTAYAYVGRDECSSVIFRLTSQPVELVKPKLIKLKGLQIEESIELLDRKKQKHNPDQVLGQLPLTY